VVQSHTQIDRLHVQYMLSGTPCACTGLLCTLMSPAGLGQV
jgi:hypothetical protein